ncbi:MAG: hypothetical protein AABZ74_01340 [Cyanobacteriota bacterium]
MKKKLFSLLVILVLFSNQKVFCGELIKNIVTDVPIEKYSYIDFGFSGLALQAKYSKDITDYYELSGKLGYGSIANSIISSFSYAGSSGFDFSIENKFFFYKTNKHYSKKDKTNTNSFYIKAFAGITKDTAIKSSFLMDSIFPILGTGIGWKNMMDGFGFSMGLDVGTTIQKPEGQGIQGMFFTKPELSIIWAF